MLNERLKNLRLAKGLTLQKVGEAFGISKASVSSWESGKSYPDHKRLEALAELLGTTVQFLIAGNADHFSVVSSTNKVPFIEWSSLLRKIASEKANLLVTPLHSKPSIKAFATRYPSAENFHWQQGSIPAGSLLIVDPTITPGPHDTVIAEINKEITLARFIATPENKSILVKADTTEFKQISISNSKIIGVVLEWQISAKIK